MKVNLKIKENNKVETIQHEDEELNLFQVTRAIKVIKDVFKIAQEDDNLQALLSEMFEEAQSEEGTYQSGQNFAQHLVGAMDILLEELPEKAFELLSILSNVDYDTFVQQKPEDALDIYDAVIQVNDLEKLINRAKKSLALTKAQTKVMNLFPKKEQYKEKYESIYEEITT